mmetsp:Transcript_37942/g.100360  ORF Transcript_37942/g.100360 Transcript_37942/m.100360 type:complete len:207 (-) Transcript_37942:87-707(-)
MQAAWLSVAAPRDAGSAREVSVAAVGAGATEDDLRVYKAMMIVAIVIIGVFFLIYNLELYRIIPGWGPVRKFDSDGSEDLKIGQWMIHHHAVEHDHPAIKAHKMHNGIFEPAPEPGDEHGALCYGSMGPPTWGSIEAPWTYREKVQHPVHGECYIKHGFSDTQFLREHSTHWARDEPHYMEANGVTASRQLVFSDPSGETLQQAVL